MPPYYRTPEEAEAALWGSSLMYATGRVLYHPAIFIFAYSFGGFNVIPLLLIVAFAAIVLKLLYTRDLARIYGWGAWETFCNTPSLKCGTALFGIALAGAAIAKGGSAGSMDPMENYGLAKLVFGIFLLYIAAQKPKAPRL